MKESTKYAPLFVLGLLIAVVPQGCSSNDPEPSSGGPTTSCTPSETLCEGVCVDLSSDESHCGICGRSCPDGMLCVLGQCECPAGRTFCDDGCVETDSDENHCGACGKACPDAMLCIAGQCGCPTGQVHCTEGCVLTDSDEKHCGGCGNACPAAQDCVGGGCVCPNDEELCGQECVDTETSSEHCGDCGTSCDPGYHCVQGDCRSISGCDVVPEDSYEDNDTCDLAKPLPFALEGEPALVIGDLTLHHQDQSIDTDWYTIEAKEGSSWCMPGSKLCSYHFEIAFTPPDVSLYSSYKMCLSTGSCGAFDMEVCTDPSHWNAQAGRYEMIHSWEGICGLDNSQKFYVNISHECGLEICSPYHLEYRLFFAEGECS